MYFEFIIKVEAERTEGKFASREDIGDQILQEIDGANPSSITGENGGEYEITNWEVEEIEQKKAGRK